MRALLVQSAKRLLQVNKPAAKVGPGCGHGRGRNKAAVAVARKLCVAVWHLIQGHVIGALKRLDTLQTKLSKFATELGVPAIKELGYESESAFIEAKL